MLGDIQGISTTLYLELTREGGSIFGRSRGFKIYEFLRWPAVVHRLPVREVVEGMDEILMVHRWTMCGNAMDH